MIKKKIKIKTEKEFNELLLQGYVVVDRSGSFSFSRGEDGEIKTDYSYGHIYLEKDDVRLIVDCSELGALFALQYNQFANIDGVYMDKTSDHTTKTDIEMYTYDHFDQHRKPCVHIEKINSKNSKKIINFLKAYTESEIQLYKKNNFGKNMFNLFSNVLILTENEDTIDCEIIDKNSTSIQKIVDLKKKSNHVKNCFAFSYFYIYSKSNQSEFSPDIFLGCILYDLKNQKTVSFNMCSTYESETLQKISAPELFIKSCRRLLEKSYQQENFLSIMHVSLFHANYTPLPWIFFSTLYNFTYIQNNELKSQITIPEFFVFGISKELNNEDSFYYKNITENSKGRAVIRFDLLDNEKIDYNLRFDVSPEERFLHVDFGYYNGKMTKLLSHFLIDMKKVQEFSKRMFVSLMSAGFYDPDFAKILKNKLKNTAEIIKQYKELSEPLKIIHLSDEKANWLDENNLTEEYIKIFNNDENVNHTKYNQILKQYSHLYSKDKQGKIGFSHEGLMVLVRVHKGINSKLYFLENYFLKHNVIHK